MPLELIDVQAHTGAVSECTRRPPPASELLEELDRHGIAKALVRSGPDRRDFDLCRTNQHLFDECAEHEQLIPCPIVAPSPCGDLPSAEEQVDAAIGAGAAAVTIRPGADQWATVPWVADPLFGALEERRLPVAVPEQEVALTEAGALAGRYPQLSWIVLAVGYRNHRVLLPLLQTFPNVFLSLGNAFTAHRGIEFYVERIGAQRLLFGTGLPDSEAGAALAQLTYADISDSVKTSIAAGNIRRLQEEIRR